MKEILFGAAYYDEYMPCERLEEDIQMMKKAGMNTVRIAESTWSTCEPQEGKFDFSHVDRVLDAMDKAGIHVIVGTPTYAVPTWMVKSHPDILATTVNGRGIYGPRQIMDITHPAYLYYAERVIRRLIERTADRECVIGFQIDNETKHYGTAGKNVQEKFVKYLREKFHGSLDELNAAFGLDYWSNRINAWEDFPDVRGTINGSLGAEFEKFQRTLVDDFLSWQADILREYCREDQFITHNFDFEWRGHSYGVQPDVDHYHAAKCLTIAGADIYHPSQDELTGLEIAFGGDLTRSLKQDNYLILETEAQGFPGWLPYKGQLRLQAYSHIASGSNSVMYWHWHSLHNACETYWKGLLSHDFQENATYQEACVIGRELKEKGSHLVNLKKKNDVAILVSNEALTALKWFGIEASAADNGKTTYNDVVHWLYDVLYRMNVECDFVFPESEGLKHYKMIVVPALYSAPDELLERLNRYVEDGGTLVATFKTAFTDENVKVSHEVQPRIIRDCLGIRYHHFTFPKNVSLSGEMTEGWEDGRDRKARTFMELVLPETAEVLLAYDHYKWNGHAAVTRNQSGAGTAYYIACMMDDALLEKILLKALESAGITDVGKVHFPVIIRKGTNSFGRNVWFCLNYSGQEQGLEFRYGAGTELLAGEMVKEGECIRVPAWGVKIIESLSSAKDMIPGNGQAMES